MLSEKSSWIHLIGFLIIIDMILAWGDTSAGSKIYKWTDDKGHVHYSENPQGAVKQSWVEKSKSSKNVGDLLAAGQWYGYYKGKKISLNINAHLFSLTSYGEKQSSRIANGKVKISGKKVELTWFESSQWPEMRDQVEVWGINRLTSSRLVLTNSGRWDLKRLNNERQISSYDVRFIGTWAEKTQVNFRYRLTTKSIYFEHYKNKRWQTVMQGNWRVELNQLIFDWVKIMQSHWNQEFKQEKSWNYQFLEGDRLQLKNKHGKVINLERQYEH